MLHSTWNKVKRPAGRVTSYCVLAGLIAMVACRTNRGYDPAPRMGAEYRFEEGLRKEKKPQYLFDKKTRKDMAQMGYPTGEPNQVPAQAGGAKSTMTAPATGTPGGARKDSVRMDTVFKVKPQ